MGLDSSYQGFGSRTLTIDWSEGCPASCTAEAIGRGKGGTNAERWTYKYEGEVSPKPNLIQEVYMILPFSFRLAVRWQSLRISKKHSLSIRLLNCADVQRPVRNTIPSDNQAWSWVLTDNWSEKRKQKTKKLAQQHGVCLPHHDPSHAKSSINNSRRVALLQVKRAEPYCVMEQTAALLRFFMNIEERWNLSLSWICTVHRCFPRDAS